MKILEVRRHSLRKPGGGSQLSQHGVTYARTLGESMGPFAYVATSVAARTRETAIAMGFAVDQELVTLASDEAVYVELEASRWWHSSQVFVAAAALIHQRGAAWRYASALVVQWRDLLTPLSAGEAALFIGHSGELELGLVAALPQGDFATWGGSFGPCEGARLVFEGQPERFTRVEMLRESTG